VADSHPDCPCLTERLGRDLLFLKETLNIQRSPRNAGHPMCLMIAQISEVSAWGFFKKDLPSVCLWKNPRATNPTHPKLDLWDAFNNNIVETVGHTPLRPAESSHQRSAGHHFC